MHGLGSLCWGVQEQLYRLRPEVMVHSLEVAQRLAPVPDAADDARMIRCGADEAFSADADDSSWRVVLSYAGEPTPVVMEQAKLGRVRLIDARCTALSEEVAIDRSTASWYHALHVSHATRSRDAGSLTFASPIAIAHLYSSPI